MLTCSAWIVSKRALAAHTKFVRPLKWQTFFWVSYTALKQSMLLSHNCAHAVTEATLGVTNVDGPVKSVPAHTRYLIPPEPVKTLSVPGQALRAFVAWKRMAAESSARTLESILNVNADCWPGKIFSDYAPLYPIYCPNESFSLDLFLYHPSRGIRKRLPSKRGAGGSLV
jgi:hypothetical protein